MKRLRKSFSELARYPSAIFGIIIVLGLVVLAVYAMVKIPYNEAIRLWRGGEEVWYQNPRNVPPSWYNYFTKEKLPESFAVKVGEDGLTKVVTPGEQDTTSIEFTYSFEFDYDSFPQEIFLYFTSTYKEKQPFVSVYLITPDEREIRIGDFGVSQKQTYRFSQDEKLKRRL